jgi:heme/copper-type cytochrome/quinol oxidase subunit 4
MINIIHILLYVLIFIHIDIGKSRNYINCIIVIVIIIIIIIIIIIYLCI